MRVLSRWNCEFAGNVADSEVFAPLVDRGAREVTADKSYDTNANHRHLQVNGQRSSIMVKKNRVDPQVMGRADPDSWPSAVHRAQVCRAEKVSRVAPGAVLGLAKVTIQVLVVCIVVNCQRMAIDRSIPLFSPIKSRLICSSLNSTAPDTGSTLTRGNSMGRTPPALTGVSGCLVVCHWLRASGVLIWPEQA